MSQKCQDRSLQLSRPKTRKLRASLISSSAFRESALDA